MKSPSQGSTISCFTTRLELMGMSDTGRLRADGTETRRREAAHCRRGVSPFIAGPFAFLHTSRSLLAYSAAAGPAVSLENARPLHVRVR